LPGNAVGDAHVALRNARLGLRRANSITPKNCGPLDSGAISTAGTSDGCHLQALRDGYHGTMTKPADPFEVGHLFGRELQTGRNLTAVLVGPGDHHPHVFAALLGP
jgi:hypothetical protein